MRKFLAFGDIHSYHGIDIRPLLRFARKFKPNVLILTGDICNFDAISYWKAKKRNRNIDDAIKKTDEEIKFINKLMDTIDSAMPNSCTRVFLMGNHEHRLDSFQEEWAQLDKKNVSEFLKLKERGYRVVSMDSWYQLGKLYFLHGQQYKGDFYTKVAGVRCQRNLRLWDKHTNQEYSIQSPLDSNQKISVKGVGGLCDLAPEYMYGKTNRWTHSFLVGYVHDNGNFQDYTVNIINGGFMAPSGEAY